MAAAGVALALGSDSPVTPFDPWGAVRAAVHHRDRARLGSIRAPPSPRTPAAAGAPPAATTTASLAVGAAATFAVWDADRARAARPRPRTAAADLLRTVVRGREVFAA